MANKYKADTKSDTVPLGKGPDLKIDIPVETQPLNEDDINPDFADGTAEVVGKDKFNKDVREKQLENQLANLIHSSDYKAALKKADELLLENEANVVLLDNLIFIIEGSYQEKGGMPYKTGKVHRSSRLS